MTDKMKLLSMHLNIARDMLAASKRLLHEAKNDAGPALSEDRASKVEIFEANQSIQAICHFSNLIENEVHKIFSRAFNLDDGYEDAKKEKAERLKRIENVSLKKILEGAQTKSN